MLVLTLLIFLTLSFGAGYAVHKSIHLKDNLNRYPEPPVLDTAEHVVNYLEACAIDNTEMVKLFGDFRSFVDKNQKQLPAPVMVSKVVTKPDWHHNPQVSPSPREHWELFFEDLKRETESIAKIGVIKHWMLDLGNNFTFKEMELMLDLFDNSKDRAAVRKIYAGRKKARKKESNG